MIGKASVEPGAALDLVGMVPPGGRDNYFATTTGARVLSAAAKTDYDATVAWLAGHPGRLGREDLMGLAQTVTDRLNADPVSFLAAHTADGSLSVLLPAVQSALLNSASGQRPVVWEWLKKQPETDIIKDLKQEVLQSASWQDPLLAMRMAADIPGGDEGDKYVKGIARSLLNNGSRAHAFEKFLEQAPKRLRPALYEEAFSSLHGHNVDDPQRWIARLSQLPEGSRTRAAESLARAWSQHRPEDAMQWAAALADAEARRSAISAVMPNWATQDAHGAAQWLSAFPPGAERDRSAQAFVYAVANQYPHDAWEWALSIQNEPLRNTAATHVARSLAARDPVAARQLVEGGSLTPEMRTAIQTAIEGAGTQSSVK